MNFGDDDLNAASQYPEPLALVRERVKPIRDQLPDYKRRVREAWWRYEYTGRELYLRITGLPRCLALSRVGKTVMPLYTMTDFTFGDAVVVFAYDDDFHFGVLTSAFHWWWTVKYASTMRQDIRYTPTDVFDTFPQPAYTDAIADTGRQLDEHRKRLMVDRNEGLTKTYNRVNDPRDSNSDIVELRRLHVALDEAVASAYGWNDLVLAHDFQDTRVGVRFTVASAAQTEILDRMLELNHIRYAREQADAATGGRTPRRRAGRAPGQLSLVGEN